MQHAEPGIWTGPDKLDSFMKTLRTSRIQHCRNATLIYILCDKNCTGREGCFRILQNGMSGEEKGDRFQLQRQHTHSYRSWHGMACPTWNVVRGHMGRRNSTTTNQTLPGRFFDENFFSWCQRTQHLNLTDLVFSPYNVLLRFRKAIIFIQYNSPDIRFLPFLSYGKGIS